MDFDEFLAKHVPRCLFASRFSGMTVNERLYEAGLLASWDTAMRNNDRGVMIQMLVSVDLIPKEAEQVVDSVLRREHFQKEREALDAMSVAELAQEYSKQFGRPADLSIGVANLKDLILTDRRMNIPP